MKYKVRCVRDKFLLRKRSLTEKMNSLLKGEYFKKYGWRRIVVETARK